MKKNVHTAGKSRKQKKIMLLLLELLIILLLAIALFITTKLSKIEKNKLDMNDVSTVSYTHLTPNYQKLKRISWT